MRRIEKGDLLSIEAENMIASADCRMCMSDFVWKLSATTASCLTGRWSQ
jgi:hypothetical protein